MVKRIVFLDRGTIGPAVTIREPAFAHDWIDHEKTKAGEVSERLYGAEIAVTNKVPLRAENFAELPNLKFVAVAASGHDVIDLAAAERHGVIVANVRGYARETVAEHTFALILALRRNLIKYREDVLAGRWQQADQFCFFNEPIRALASSTLGIIGCGEIGRAVGRIGLSFGMRVVYLRRRSARPPSGSEIATLDQLLAAVDVLTCHCPLTTETRGLVDIAAFRKMKASAIIVNTARGGILNEADLVTAIETGEIAGAGIDVVATEPPSADDPLMQLARRPNVLLTPHVAWASVEAMQLLADRLIDNIEAYAEGRPQNVLRANRSSVIGN